MFGEMPMENIPNRHTVETGSENMRAVIMICLVFALAIGSALWWWLTTGKFATQNPGLSELQSRRAIRGCINGEMWAFVEHGKTMGEVYAQKDGRFIRMECRPGHEEDGLVMREVCLKGKDRGAQVLHGPWKNETFVLLSKTRKDGDIEWHSQPCRPGIPAAESFYQ